MRIFAFLLLLGWLVPGDALYEDLSAGPVTDALAGAYVAYAAGIDAVYTNPAGLAQTSRFMAETFYKPLYGGLGIGLRTLQASIALPYHGTMVAFSYKETGASLQTQGYESAYTGAYRESAWTFSMARFLTEGLALGMNLHLFRFQEPRFGGTSTFGLDLGLLGRVNTRWTLGASIQNFNRPSLHGTYRNEPLPVTIAVGLSYRPWASATTVVEAQKTMDHPARLSFGQEIRFAQDRIALRLGLAQEGEVTTPTLGFGLTSGSLQLNYAAVFSLDLPLTHVFGLSYRR